MGLKSLLIDSGEEFRQRSFGYGENAPLITKELPGVLEEPNALTGAINGVSDGFIRGGAILAAERAFTDTKRIGKFLLTGEGLSFLAKEAAIQRTNPQSLISPTNRTRTPLNLIAQIPLAFTGTHVRRDGLLDTVFESNFNYDYDRRGGKKYETEIREILRAGEEGAYQTKTVTNISGVQQFNMANIAPEVTTETVKLTTQNPKTLLALYNNFQISPGLSLIKEYSGGADSVFGIGNTQIKKYEDVGRPDEDYIQQQINKGKEKIRGGSMYKMGDPDRNPSPDGTYTYNSPTVDQINVADIFSRENLIANEDAESLKDLIKFKIALIDTQEPLNDEVLLFRAHIEGVNDSFTGNWNSYQYNGRPENFYVYNGFDRDISFNFKVAPQSLIELKYLYKKLNYLVGSTAPEYVNRRMRGRYVRLTIGDWIYELPGFFPSIGLSWDSSFPWELNPDNDDLLSQHPQVLNVACNFKPIHDFAPESKKDSPFIIRREKQTITPSWPNPPLPVEPVPSLTPSISSNTPTPELQQASQTKLNDAVTGQTENIQFKRIFGAGGEGGALRSEIDFGTVNKIPELDDYANADSVANLLTGLASGKSATVPVEGIVDNNRPGF